MPNRAFVLAAHSVRVVTALLSCERHSPGRRRRHHCPSSLLEPIQNDLHRKSEMNGAFQPNETRKALQCAHDQIRCQIRCGGRRSSSAARARKSLRAAMVPAHTSSITWVDRQSGIRLLDAPFVRRNGGRYPGIHAPTRRAGHFPALTHVATKLGGLQPNAIEPRSSSRISPGRRYSRDGLRVASAKADLGPQSRCG